MGAHFTTPPLHAEMGQTCRAFLTRQGRVWGADARGEPLERTRAVNRMAIVVGNEGSGLSPDVRAKADRSSRLPIANNVESLNVAVAAGIILHELRP